MLKLLVLRKVILILDSMFLNGNGAMLLTNLNFFFWIFNRLLLRRLYWSLILIDKSGAIGWTCEGLLQIDRVTVSCLSSCVIYHGSCWRRVTIVIDWWLATLLIWLLGIGRMRCIATSHESMISRGLYDLVIPDLFIEKPWSSLVLVLSRSLINDMQLLFGLFSTSKNVTLLFSIRINIERWWATTAHMYSWTLTWLGWIYHLLNNSLLPSLIDSFLKSKFWKKLTVTTSSTWYIAFYRRLLWIRTNLLYCCLRILLILLSIDHFHIIVNKLLIWSSLSISSTVLRSDLSSGIPSRKLTILVMSWEIRWTRVLGILSLLSTLALSPWNNNILIMLSC